MGTLTSEPKRKGRHLSIEQGQERLSRIEEMAKGTAHVVKEIGTFRSLPGTCTAQSASEE